VPERVDVAVVGAGAAGLAAAVVAARRGASVAVLERLPRIGKKLLATGGGRCNLLNERLSPEAFTSTAPELVASVFARTGAAEIRSFFEGLGLRLTADESGRIWPATNQAVSVLRVLELEVRRRGVSVETGFEVRSIEGAASAMSVASGDGRTVRAAAVVLAAGGRSYPALGSDGSGYALAAAVGHRVVTPVPSAVPLLVRSGMCHALQGLRTRVRIEGRIGGRTAQAADGELLFTQYGLSGTAVLDVSESLSVALNRDGRSDAAVVVDFAPFLGEAELAAVLRDRLAAGWAAEDLGAGILPEKLARFLPRLDDERGPGARAGDASATARRLASRLKAAEFRVQGTRGWNEAEFTSGGVDAREVAPGTLESRLRRGLYFAGEVLDVQAGRGGYNLGWAWASGLTAGLAG
jgi:hypothetical protein